MPQFSYTVINKENRQLTGTINAPDEPSARKELNALGFSILNLFQGNLAGADSQNEESSAEMGTIVKFDFSAFDKNGKKVVGTIQGENPFSVYKRLVKEYQFEMQYLFPSDLKDEEKEKLKIRGVDDLKDRLLEEQMAAELELKKKEINEKEFQEKQIKLKAQVDFVLQKVNELLENYKEEIDPTRKAKIKYFVEKILRIKNSTNLDYIKQTCEEMLTYLQKEELFLNQEQRMKEKTKLSIEAKSMMMQLNRISNPGGKDIFESLREWRQDHIKDNPNATIIDKAINILITPLIGQVVEDIEITEAKQKIKSTNGQLKEFLILYFQAPDPEFKKETKATLQRLWNQRKLDKKILQELLHKKHENRLANVEFTAIETLEKEIFSVAGWVLSFYIAYYFLTIYLNSKEIDFIPETKLNLIFQTSVIKYFFTTLFLFVCLLGIKIEFFKRKPLITPLIVLVFLLSSSLIILNF